MAVRLVSEADRVRDGEAAGLPGAKVFWAHPCPQARRHALDPRCPSDRPRRKVLRSLTRADSGAIRRICFRTHVCVVRRQVCPTRAGKRRDRTRETDGAVESFWPCQNRPERNPAERPGSDALARRANRTSGCNAAMRPDGRLRDRPGADISTATWGTSGGDL